MKAPAIKNVWNEFRAGKNTPEERKHVWSKPASLIVNNEDDPTTLFNTAGMQSLVPYLMGKEHPTGSKRVYNIQGCVRTSDIEDVGDRSHLTYFEMMGNRSLGDYFRKESIERSRHFLTGVLSLDPKKLAVTVFEGDDNAPKDTKSAEIWKQQGVPEDRISYLPKSENRWGPAGAVGPCGPDSEIFYRIGPSDYPKAGSTPGNDEDNRMEIWNNVFMAYYKDADGSYTELTDKNVDTGMGFERIALVLQHEAGMIKKPLKEASVYDTDIFKPVLDLLDKYATPTDAQVVQGVQAQRIVADHMRTAMMLIQEGLIPSNESRGYVLRRIIRRMFFQWRNLGGDDLSVFEEVLYHIKHHFNTIYPDYFTTQTALVIIDEVKQFAKTIEQGVVLVDEMIESIQSASNDDWQFPGEKAFKLYDTYGFPVELTQEIVQERGGFVDMDGFDRAMEEAKERSRAGSQQKFEKGTDRATVIDGLDETTFTGYTALESDDATIIKDLYLGDQRIIITDKTPFYAEGGGQTGDTGWIEMADKTTLKVTDVIKYGGVWIHMVQ